MSWWKQISWANVLDCLCSHRWDTVDIVDTYVPRSVYCSKICSAGWTCELHLPPSTTPESLSLSWSLHLSHFKTLPAFSWNSVLRILLVKDSHWAVFPALLQHLWTSSLLSPAPNISRHCDYESLTGSWEVSQPRQGDLNRNNHWCPPAPALHCNQGL